MFDRDAIERAKKLRHGWEAGELRRFLDRQPESREEYRTGSGLPVQRVYTPVDVADMSMDDLGLPGQYPFTRGPYPTMYRGRLWTMRQIAGFGTGSDTNKRFRYLIERMTESQILEIDRSEDVANCSITSYRFERSVERRGKLVLESYNFVAPLVEEGTAVTTRPDDPVAPR